MKRKFLKRALFISVGLVILSISVLTAFAATSSSGYGCPQDTGGYLSKGTRKSYDCKHSIIEKGYWWYIEGEVKWVGAVFAGMGGSYQEGQKTTVINGTEYKCDGFGSDPCWVCNCYSIAATLID
jgi:hypothetical protein